MLVCPELAIHQMKQMEKFDSGNNTAVVCHHLVTKYADSKLIDHGYSKADFDLYLNPPFQPLISVISTVLDVNNHTLLFYIWLGLMFSAAAFALLN